MLRLSARIGWAHALCLWISISICVRPIIAQELSSNLAVYQQLATQCLGSFADEGDSLIVAPPANMPYLTGALFTLWQKEGRVVFDRTLVKVNAALPALSWRIERALVSYVREPRKMVTRTVNLDLRFTMASASGQILEHDVCRQQYDDVVPRDQLAALETVAYPETHAEAPPASWPRRYLEPAVLGMATALAAFLFFNLRSSRADS